MVLCKFYQQGYCRFGDSCKFEHEQKGHQQMWGFSPLMQQQQQQQTFNAPPKQTQNPANVDTNTLVKSVTTDMLGAEKGGQWLLSCYAPFKEKPEFPGFEDYSFEEIRLMFYEAKTNGSIEQVKQQYQAMLQQAMMKIKALQNPSPEVINVLRTIYNTPPKTTVTNLSGTQNSIFAGGTPNNVFQQNQQVITPQPTNIFAAASQNLFSNAASATSNNNNSIFGGNTQPQPTFNNNSVFAGGQSSSIFGGGSNTSPMINSNSVFSNQQSNNNIFATPAPPVQVSQTGQNSIFGTSPLVPTTSNNLFNSNQTSFVSPQFSNQQNSVFSQQQMNTNTNIFGQPNVNVIEISTPAASTGSFFSTATQPINNNNGGSIFTQQQQPSSVFQTQQNTVSSNIFANSLSNNSLVASSRPEPPAHQQHAYSKLEDLSESDIKWFQSDELDLENIPENPPTYEMCF